MSLPRRHRWIRCLDYAVHNELRSDPAVSRRIRLYGLGHCRPQPSFLWLLGSFGGASDLIKLCPLCRSCRSHPLLLGRWHVAACCFPFVGIAVQRPSASGSVTVPFADVASWGVSSADSLTAWSRQSSRLSLPVLCMYCRSVSFVVH